MNHSQGGLPPPEPKATKADLEAAENRRRADRQEMEEKLRIALGAEGRLHELDDRLKALEVDFPTIREKALDASRKATLYEQHRADDRVAMEKQMATYKAWSLIISSLAAILALAMTIKALASGK